MLVTGRPGYVVAIPSHRRVSTLASRTLAYLACTDVPLERVHVFVSDAEDAARYRKAFPAVTVVEPAKPIPNVAAKFNAIHAHYEPGTPVFVMEDDVDLVAGSGGANDAKPLTELEKTINMGFAALEGKPGMWGIAPHSNGFFFSGKVKRGLMLVVAHAFGFIATRDPALRVTQIGKSDYERTCRYWRETQNLVRLDWVGVRTKSYTAAGGMQAQLQREQRAAAEAAACDYLVHAFPDLLRRNEKKKSIFPELSFIKQAGT